jgi:hypothetical protein
MNLSPYILSHKLRGRIWKQNNIAKERAEESRYQYFLLKLNNISKSKFDISLLHLGLAFAFMKR